MQHRIEMFLRCICFHRPGANPQAHNNHRINDGANRAVGRELEPNDRNMNGRGIGVNLYSKNGLLYILKLFCI